MAINMNGYSTQRITGLFSGMDTESLVKNLLATEQAKYDKVFQQKEKAQWRYDAYSALNTSVSSLRNDYFSVLGEKSLTKNAAYNAYKVTMDTNSAVRVTGTANAMPTNFRILSASRATAAGVTGIVNSSQTEAAGQSGMYLQAQASGTIASDAALSADSTIAELATQFGLGAGENLSFSVNGETFTFEQSATLAEVQSRINDSEKANATLSIDYANKTFSIKSDTIGSDTALSLGNITGKAFATDGGFAMEGPAAKKSVIDGSMTFKELASLKGQELSGDYSFRINETDFNITENMTISEVMNQINTSGAGVKMSIDDATGAFIFRNSSGTEAIRLEGAIFGKDSVTGIEAGEHTTAGRINRSDSLQTAARKLGHTLSDEVTVTVNGKDFTFNTRTTTLSGMMSTINGDQQAKATFSYSELTDSFQIASDETGSSARLTFDFGELEDVFGLSMNGSASLSGTDALMKVESNGVTREVVQSSNSFTLDGMTFQITGELTEAQSPLQVSVERDVEPTISAIKSFIEDYNKLVGDLNGKYYEKAYRTYTPLTEDQRSEMSEKEAELWDEKAKSGILRNDSAIGSLLTNLRSALAVKVGDTGMSAYDIGISTVAWKTDSWRTEQGKLQLDESKLRAALEKDPDAVQKVLSAVSTGSDGTADTSVSSVNGTQKSEAGLFTRMNAFFTSFNSTMRSKNIVNEQKSISNYTEKLSEMLTKMSEKEEKYWAQFSKLETALSEMQSQQSWLSSQLGLSA